MSQWLWIMVHLAKPVVVNHGELWWASCCELRWVMLSLLLWIVMCYAEPDSQPLAQHSTPYSQPLDQNNTPWFTTTGSETHHDSQPLDQHNPIMIHNHWLRITQHDSQPLAHNNTSWFTTNGSAKYTMIHNHRPMVYHSEPVVVNSYVLF
jgi:hypothetical protein